MLRGVHGCAAPCWGRPPSVVRIVSATRPEQPAAASTGVRLDADAVARLDEVSAEPLGPPHAFLREPPVTRDVYGDRRQDIDDRRSAQRRTASSDGP
ncbi:hypothetical protein [Streptomyces sp. NPDC048521]|uniref:hypothetical protein n=1 Tax=Streptomyces sp. NPDC048521 TaxID=3365566 RepID=UPI003720454E